MDRMSDFIFAFGQMIGGLHRPDVQKFFLDRGVGSDEIQHLIDCQKKMSRAFYTDPAPIAPLKKYVEGIREN